MPEAKYAMICQCGGVEMELVGAPIASLHCHCTICQNWSGAPYLWMVLFPADKISVVEGKDNITHTKTSDAMERGRCKTCTSHIYDHTIGQDYAVPGVTIQGIRSEDRTFVEGFAPTAEIFYGTRVKDMNGGLPTYDGFPPKP
ncbi:unnamed protein product [Pylaiella littoralis]